MRISSSLLQVMDKSSDAEAEKLRKDLHDLNQRFAMLHAGATQRVSVMTDALRLAKQFRDHYEPALAWLDGAEKRVAGLESAGIEPTQIQQDIEEHKVSSIPTFQTHSPRCSVLHSFSFSVVLP